MMGFLRDSGCILTLLAIGAAIGASFALLGLRL